MADPMQPAVPATTTSPTGDAGATTGELLVRLSDQTARLVRDELALAKVEMTEKAKHVGIGAGLFGAAGVLALYGLGALVATVVLVLALFLDAWLAALVVTVALFVLAGLAALFGRGQVGAGTPVAPEATVASVKEDLAEVKEARQR